MRMTTADDVLERHFAGLSPEELDTRLSTVPQPGTAPLGEDARAHLTAHGGPEVAAAWADIDSSVLHRERTVVAAQSLSEMLRDSADMDEAAELLGVSRSRISHRIAAGTLVGFTLGHRRRIPRWQIAANGSVLPGLGDIVAAIPSGVHPVALQSFMTTDQPEFDGLSPVAYLQSGGSPRVIAGWVADLGR